MGEVAVGASVPVGWTLGRRGLSSAPPLVRPGSEHFAVAFDESFALKIRKALAVFVALALPHPNQRIRAGIAEAIHLLGVLGEMMLQRGPVAAANVFMVANSSRGVVPHSAMKL